MTKEDQPWLIVDKDGLRKTLERKGKAFAIYELLQNAFDEASTEVSVTLTEPKNGKSTLICVDDAPLGYTDLSCTHTMFAESKKKTDHKKRGRFNVGEKYVLALCDKATITSTTGRVIFNQVVPEEMGFINELLSKKTLRDIITQIYQNTGLARAAKFLDDIKDLGFRMAFRGGLSFNLNDVIIPVEKEKFVNKANEEVSHLPGFRSKVLAQLLAHRQQGII